MCFWHVAALYHRWIGAGPTGWWSWSIGGGYRLRLGGGGARDDHRRGHGGGRRGAGDRIPQVQLNALGGGHRAADKASGKRMSNRWTFLPAPMSY